MWLIHRKLDYFYLRLWPTPLFKPRCDWTTQKLLLLRTVSCFRQDVFFWHFFPNIHLCFNSSYFTAMLVRKDLFKKSLQSLKKMQLQEESQQIFFPLLARNWSLAFVLDTRALKKEDQSQCFSFLRRHRRKGSQ